MHNFYRKRYVGGEDKVFLGELRALRERLGQESVLSFTVDNEGLGAALQELRSGNPGAHPPASTGTSC